MATAGAQSDFFDELKVWSEIKLNILTKYLDAYLRKRGKANPTIYYVDGFAGAGTYGDGQEVKEGSPLRIARLAQNAFALNKPYQLICLNCERSPARCQKLKQALAPFDSELVRVYCGDFTHQLPQILVTTQGAPAIVFLDPFGVKPITLAQLRPLLQRPDTELFINFNTRALRRLAGNADSLNPQALAKVHLVNQVLGEDTNTSAPEWLGLWRSSETDEWLSWAVGHYMDRLVGTGTELERAVAYPIRERHGGDPKYYLLFLTRYKPAVVIINDILCTEEDELFERTVGRTKDGQYTMWQLFREQELGNRLVVLLDEIYSYGLEHQGCTRRDIIEHFVWDQFGRFKSKHYGRALDELVAQNRARFSKSGKTKDADPIIFIPNGHF